MIFLSLFDTGLPITNPVLKFLLILIIILVAPLLLNRIKIPPLLGLIIAGAVVGPNGFNLMERDSGIILSGTAGLLYIMFLAGLEIDMADFKRNRNKSLVFGMYTFLIPMGLGFLAGFYLLSFSVPTSILLASMFASHTLIAYPLISKLGVAKNRAVNIAVGGTMITDTLALLVLAVIVGMTAGEVNTAFWVRLSVSIIAFGLIVWFIFPLIGRWFFKRFQDHVSQYIFVLVMVFLAAVLAEMAGIEAIIGAFLAGLALNRLIPQTSPLMNRIEFVGNAIFIPFFLIGVGMLIDYRVFFQDLETIKVAAVMTIVASSAKFMAAWLTQKTYNFSADERSLIFGLSNAQAAATLAAVLIGYNIITGETATGEPVRLLNESVLNGTILMILVTCTIASFVAQKGAKNLAMAEARGIASEEEEVSERILIPVSNTETVEELLNLGLTVKSKKNISGLYALSIINNETKDEAAVKYSAKLLHQASHIASATDNFLNELVRYDINIVNGIISVVREQKITDLILGLHQKTGISDSFLGELTEGILTKCNTTTLIYKPVQPLSTVKRHIIIVPENAEKERGFPFWLIRIWNIGRSTGAKLVFYSAAETGKNLKEIFAKHPVECEFKEFTEWQDFLVLSREVQNDDNLLIVMSRKGRISYNSNMDRIPEYLNAYFEKNSFILVYPIQSGVAETGGIDLTNPAILEPVEKLDEIGKTISRLFRRK
jgi:Kef-type K+ transport system membrane component KefB/nucleotide-binding universal stress UspA family protein